MESMEQLIKIGVEQKDTLIEAYPNDSLKKASREDEGVHLLSHVSDEMRNLFLVEGLMMSHSLWRTPPAKIKDWVIGERYLNLRDVIRRVVLDDICTFFEHTGDNPWDRLYDEAVLCEGIGSGKCHRKGTKILMKDGSLRNIEDILEGDMVMGPNSLSREVLSLARGRDSMYEIVPVKGEPFVVNKNHILSLKRTNKGRLNSHRKSGGSEDSQAGNIINISLENYIAKSDTFKRLHKLWRTGVEFQDKKVLLDPYFIGLWLGDGHKHTTAVTTKDPEIVDYLYQFSEGYGLSIFINQNKNKTCPSYVISGQRIRQNTVQKKLLKYNLIRNKHIPDDYKINSREVRLKVLAGLIDSDGSLCRSSMEFSNKNKRLCEDVLFLCRSLGFAAYLKERMTSCLGTDFKSYRVSISGDLEQIPVLLKRKKAGKRKQKKNVLVTGFSVKRLGIEKYYGFTLEKDGLYLLDDFTVTHNSFKTSIIATYFQHLFLCMYCPQAYFGIDKSSKIAIMNMSISEMNARKVIFSEITSKIDNCKWFQERPWDRADARVPDPICKSELRFKNNTFIIPGSSSWRTAVGYNIAVGIMDEAGAMRKTDNSDQAEDIYLALQRRLGSRFESKGAIIIAGSPLYENDFLESKLKEGQNDPTSRVMARRRNLWDSKYPDWDGDFFYIDTVDRIFLDKEIDKNKLIIGKILKGIKDTDTENILKVPHVPFLFKSFRANVTKALRDFGGQPSASINSFFEAPKMIMERANKARTESPLDIHGKFKDWFKPIAPDAFHSVHIDLAISGDACGVALGHYDGLTEEGGIKVYIDLMIRLVGSKENRIEISKVRDYIFSLTYLGFNIGLITYDGFQSADSIQILEKKGYTAELLSVDRTMGPYTDLKECINENRLDYYYLPTNSHNHREWTPSEAFVKECMKLEEIEGKKIDHPPKMTKDVADAVCGVVHNIVSKSDSYGVIKAVVV